MAAKKNTEGLSQVNGNVNRMTEAELREELEKKGLNSAGTMDVLRRRLKDHARYRGGAVALPASEYAVCAPTIF
jgi:hypothetical protein